MVKLSAAGEKLWDKTLGGSDPDYLYDIKMAPDGGFLVGGYSYSSKSGDKSEDSRGKIDYWVVKISATGAPIWNKTLGGIDDDHLSSIVATEDGNFLLGGSSSSDQSGDKSENSRGGDDYWVIKLSSNGEKVWDKTLGGIASDNLRSMVATPDGGFVLGGSSSSKKSGEKSENAQGGYWIIKITVTGDKIWDKTLVSTSVAELYGLVSTPDGGFVLGGNLYSSGATGTPAWWIVKIK